MADKIRQQRLASFIQNKISTLITFGTIKDPRIHSMIMVTHVEVSKDLAHAKVYVSSFDDQELTKDIIAALNGASGFVQKELAKELRIRLTPQVRFFADKGSSESFDVINTINKLEEERKNKEKNRSS